MRILVSEGVGYHNQSKHFLYTQNPGLPLFLPDYISIVCVDFSSLS